MKYIIILFSALLWSSCAMIKTNPQLSDEVELNPVDSTKRNQLIGTVSDEQGNPLIGVKVMLIQKGELVITTETNIDGSYKFDNVLLGVYDLEVNYIGYQPVLKTNVKVKNNEAVDFKMVETTGPQIISLKPIIYIYPEEITEVSVELNYKGTLTHTYPKCPNEGWKMVAHPNGTLFDEKGMEYYALFWEGKPTRPIVPKDGFVVPGNKTVTFLEEKLAELGLNRREANEFIMFWLPQMENNPFNLIHFSSDVYEDLAELIITPTPETLIRLMMLIQPLDFKIEFPLQDISKLKKKRKGYTVVEWGGQFFSVNDI